MFYVNEITNEKIYCNRFNMLTQLSQHYFVDQLSRQVDPRLDHQRYMNRSSHFKKVKLKENGNNSDSDSEDEESDSDEEGDGGGTRSILGECITGSPRHLRKLSLNALHIVAARDKPHIFLTLTCNSQWPEIMERIGKYQTAFDRPDITNMVFHQRLEALLYNLRHGKYFKFVLDITLSKQYLMTIYDPLNDTYNGCYNDCSEFDKNGKLEQSIQNLKVIYDGEWKNGKRHGLGEFLQPYGVSYKGYFENDIPHGEGCLVIQRNKDYTNMIRTESKVSFERQ
jgi:hypothetical protein